MAEQGGGGARGGVAVSVLLAGRKTTGEGAAVGWAVGGAGPGKWAPGRWPRWPSLPLLLFIVFYFVLFCFGLVKY